MSRKSVEILAPSNPLINAIGEIKKSHELETLGAEAVAKSKEKTIADIMEFCDGPAYLDLLNPENDLDLYVPQRIILKCFYMGTIGNEKLELSQKEWEWLYGKEDDQEFDGVVYNKNIKDVIKKMHKRISDSDMPYFKELQLVLGRRGTKCNEINELISTTEGSITFGELHNRLSKGEKIGICTYDQKTWKRSITYDIKSENNGIVSCFTIETKRGIKETSSENHPYLVWRDEWDKPKFVKISEIKKGDRIAVAECTELFGKGSIGENEAAFLGQDQGYGANANKDIPSCIYRGSKSEVAIFLSRLFERQKFVNIEESSSNSLTVYVSSSPETVYGVRHLLQKFGIHSSIEKYAIDIWKLIITEKKYLEKFEKEINVFSKKNNLKANIKPISSVEKNIIEKSDIKWDEVEMVSDAGKKETIALEVKGTNVIGNDLVSHNTLMASVITAYEAYKLLVINNGDPHGYYRLPADDEIAIINVALSQGQAGRLFGQIQSRLRNSPFFKGRIAKETASEIRLYTDKDISKKLKGTNISVNGSIILLCGHSNPDSLAGYSTILLLFDEIAYYDETGQITGKYFYTRLKPSLSKFFKYKAARIVQISSPKGKLGIFYDTWVEAKNDDSILSFQLPTWDVNPDVPYNEPELARDRRSNPEMFAVEYGAQWAEGGSYHRYFPEDLIRRCIRGDLRPHARPEPGFNYYIHVDPAKKGNNYAAVMIGKKRYTNQRGQKRIRCVLAGLWIWRPLPGIGVQFNQVDRDMINICSIFHPICVTYDDYHSMQSLQLLRSHGINCREISYNRNVKAKLYQNLRDIMAYEPEPELYLYDIGGDSSLLIAELTNLNLKQTQNGYSIIPDRNADVKTDDLADCVAGACASANEGIRMGLPEPVTVRTGWM